MADGDHSGDSARDRRGTRTPAAGGGATASSPGAPGRSSLTARLHGRGGGALPYQAQLESAFGEDFGGVTTHLGASDVLAAEGALGAAEGDTVAFADSRPPLYLVAHEVAHVAQQRQAGTAAHAARTAVSDDADPAEREADAIAERVVADPTARVTVREAPSARVAFKKRTSSKPSPADDPTGDGPHDQNAYMTVRAYDEQGGLVTMWTGPAYFHGQLPDQFAAKKKKGKWSWTRRGEAYPDGAQLKVDSDRDGKTGTPIAAWAPAEATFIDVSFRGLTDPFGTGKIHVDPSQPLGGIVRFFARAADGAEPLDPDAPGPIHGPLEPFTTQTSGDLVVEQRAEDDVWIWLGRSTLQIAMSGVPGREKYAFTVRAQTSATQRVVEVVSTSGVSTHLDNDASSGQLVCHHRIVDDPSLIQTVRPGALHYVPAVPEIEVGGDNYRCTISMGDSHIHVECIAEDSKFAYFVDPNWSGPAGQERVVHIVATPGVKVDTYRTGDRRLPPPDRQLVANPIYVQDPALVPRQGTPIDPAQYLGADSRRYGHFEGTDEAVHATAYTGNAGVTLRDDARGLSVTIAAADPTLGARFAWYFDDPKVTGHDGILTFRALLGPGMVVHELRLQQPHNILDERAPLANHPYRDIGIDVDIRETADVAAIPVQGTPLTRDVMAPFQVRAADSISYKHGIHPAAVVAMTGLDLVAGAVPVLGDLIDVAEGVAGSDKWGNELELGERLAIGLMALWPVISGGMVKGAGKVGRAAVGGADAIASVLARTGKTAEELQVVLAHVARLDPGAVAAARRIDDAVRVGVDVDPADLRKLDEGLQALGFEKLPRTDVKLRGYDSPHSIEVKGQVPDLPENPVPFAGGQAPEPAPAAPPRTRSSELGAKEAELKAAITEQYRVMAGKTKDKPPKFRVEVLAEKTFTQRFASAKGKAVFTMTDDGPVIFATWRATARDVADEAAHLRQLADPDRAADIRILSERSLADWDQLSVADRLELYQRKLDVEIDAKRRALATLDEGPDRRLAEANLADLEDLQRQVASIDDAQLQKMNAGVIPMPHFLDQPARLFGKEKEVVPGTTKLLDTSEVAGARRPIARDKADADYSSAYGEKDVKEVRQVGDTWQERTFIVSGYDGKIIAVPDPAAGTDQIVVKHGGRTQSYAVEPGADIVVKVGDPVERGSRLANEVPRDYRLVEVVDVDGNVVPRAEIKTLDGKRSGWILRGEEASRRGALAEAQAKAAADFDLATRAKQGEISGFVHLPHRVGGGGFDDVIVEFTGSGDDLQAKIRIREVKDYPNKHVPLSEFTAIDKNWDQNLDHLKRQVRDALSGKPPAGFEKLTKVQIQAIAASLEADVFDVEVILGATTKLGQPGHHASKTLPALEGRVGRPIKVSQLGAQTNT
jgi:hypothetical protein